MPPKSKNVETSEDTDKTVDLGVTLGFESQEREIKPVTQVYTFPSRKVLWAFQAFLPTFMERIVWGSKMQMDDILACEDISEDKLFQLKITTKFGWFTPAKAKELMAKITNSESGIILGTNDWYQSDFLQWDKN